MAQQPDESREAWKRRKNARKSRILRAKNPEKARALSRKYYRQNPEKERARREACAASGAAKIYQRTHYLKNKAKRIAALDAWRLANPERYAEIKRRWYEANRHIRNAYSSKRRAQEVRATPAWANSAAIIAIYAEAVRITVETGVDHHVDHYYPLRGRTVSGLHVETNLRVIPGTENMRKHNLHPEAI